MDQAEGDALIVKHQGLPGLVYDRMRPAHAQIAYLDRDEAVSVGTVALVRAARTPTCDPTDFVRYAWKAIARELFQAAALNAIVAIPGHARKRGVAIPFGLSFDDKRYCGQPNEGLDRGIEAEELHAALEKIPPDDRWLLHARFWEERTQEELADELHMTRQAVSQREAKALRNLRDALAGLSPRRPAPIARKPRRPSAPRRPQCEYMLR